jgi:hypothetical protein
VRLRRTDLEGALRVVLPVVQREVIWRRY